MVASDDVLSEGYGHDGPGVCLGDGQTETEGVPSQGGRGDALLRRMPPHLTLNYIISVSMAGIAASENHARGILISRAPQINNDFMVSAGGGI